MATKIVNGQVVPMDPAEAAEFEGQRALTLPKAKQHTRDLIIRRRDQAETGGFAYLALRYPSDGTSLARISILAERARTAKAANAAFSVSLIAMDDSSANFSANEMIALEVAVGDHFLACSANAKTLRQAVNAATDVAGVNAINIEIGWP